jgi:2,3,4,5-tetrahydropyridine-2-carboxylate N-succinyltransferase
MTVVLKEDQESLREEILFAWEHPDSLRTAKTQNVVFRCLRLLEKGLLRVMSPPGAGPWCGDVDMKNLEHWELHSWVKQSIVLAMRIRTSQVCAWDLKTENPPKNASFSEIPFALQERIYCQQISCSDKFDMRNDLHHFGVRSVLGSWVREGAHVAVGAILMPSFVNIGAWVGGATMVDTWATVGSCAQVGKNVHLAGGVGVGGVLEPENARPVLIGDNAFLGSRVIVVEGTTVSEGAIVGANVCLTASTPLYDVTTQAKTEYRGFVPPHAVVVPGTRAKVFAGGEIPLQCAYIIAYRNPQTDVKVSLNTILRETGVSLSL